MIYKTKSRDTVIVDLRPINPLPSARWFAMQERPFHPDCTTGARPLFSAYPITGGAMIVDIQECTPTTITEDQLQRALGRSMNGFNPAASKIQELINAAGDAFLTHIKN